MVDVDIKECLATLRQGGIILYSTDTVWGIGCDATNATAVAKVFDLKCRPDSKAMLLLASDTDMLSGYVERVPEAAIRLMEQSSRPVTIIYDGARNIDSTLIADDGSIGIRVPDDDFCRKLCAELGHPIVSTSANISGEPTPQRFADISEQIRQGVDYICRHRQEEESPCPPSDIYKITSDGAITVIRKSK